MTTEHPLTEARILIGRAEGCDICFPFNEEVSRLHASLSATDQGWSIEDVTSRLGTYVNGERVLESRTLTDNDVIKIGHLELTFRRKKHSQETLLGSIDSLPAAVAAVATQPSTPEDESGGNVSTQPTSTTETLRGEPVRNYYQIIGVPDFEQNISTIHDAAKARLQTLRDGQQSDEFASVSEAMICLTKRESKRKYDQDLADQHSIELRTSGDRLIPVLPYSRSEAGMIVVGVVGLAVVAWFLAPVVMDSIQWFFSQLTGSMPSRPN
ncbi:MAG: FHA domain-containing protein [Planctomycetaceae bacterium]|nr:FHA domain-containing protein [Planctomycetaceae bacterium]